MTTHKHPHVGKATFQLSQVANPTAFKKFQTETGLADFFWQALYNTSDSHSASFEEALNHARGYVIFLHGWDATHLIWEDLPLRLLTARQDVVCLVPDVNGFGRTPFIADTPEARLCCPVGMMQAIEQWLELIHITPSHQTNNPFYLFVGHSMGGAALFYKEEQGWADVPYGFYALAPALLCNDNINKRFYKTLGLGISIPSFSYLKKRLAPRIIEVLGGGASVIVKDEHVRVFSTTPFGTVAQTIYAMGALAVKPKRNDWKNFQIALGHRDRLVGLENMLQLLEEFDVRADQIRIGLGDHYFFSHDKQSPHSHRHNREIVLQDLLNFCARLTP